ncbi:MAG: cytochrome c3 family protein, partial [Planctomycetota bacterium]
MFKSSSHVVVGLAIVVLIAGSAIALVPPHDESNQIGCDDCHALGRGYFYPDSGSQEAMCRTCHNPTGVASAMSDVANHGIHGGNSTITCSSCHAPHGPHTTADPHSEGQTAQNLKLIRGNTDRYVSSEANPMLFQLDPEHFAFGEGNPPWTGICQTCHTQTKHHTNDGSADHEHQIGSNCTACHRHENGFAPSDGLCTGCHSQQQGLRRQIVGSGGDFGRRSSHVSGTVDDEDCITCHDMDKHQQGEVRLKDLDNGAVWTGGRDEWCLRCHDGDPPAGVVFPPEKGSGYDKSSFFNSTHNQHMGSNSCSHCHHAHGSPHRSLLKATYIATDYNRASQGGGDYALCWKCHDRDGILTGDNTFDRHHDRHVNGTDSPCFVCHDVHAPADVTEAGLINLDHAVQQGYDIGYVDGYDASTAFGFMDDLGYCYLTCHSKPHEPQAYEPQAGPAPSCLPCHLPNGEFVHDPQPPYCSDCHWDDRPTLPHPEFEDCANCHGSPGGGWQGATYDHEPPPIACNFCHEDNRPASPHSQGLDCASCHGEPGISWKGAAYDHNPTPNTCAECHEHSRPALPHPQTVDCENCHADPGGSWKGGAYDHSPRPNICAVCHEDSRPPSPHPQGTDCAACHTDPGGGWANVSWNHEPSPSLCASCHEGSRPSSPHPQSGDCSSCHGDA